MFPSPSKSSATGWAHKPTDRRPFTPTRPYAAPWRAKPAYRHTVESTIYLAPDHIGRGLGRRLLRALQRHCALAGVEQMIAVIADSGNPASIALHRTCGFTDAGRLRNVGRKHGWLLDTLLMQHDLTVERAG